MIRAIIKKTVHHNIMFILVFFLNLAVHSITPVLIGLTNSRCKKFCFDQRFEIDKYALL